MLNLKQGALSLASAKRTNSIPNGKKTSVTEEGKNKRVEIPVEVQNVVETLSSDEEGRRFTNGSHRAGQANTCEYEDAVDDLLERPSKHPHNHRSPRNRNLLQR